MKISITSQWSDQLICTSLLWIIYLVLTFINLTDKAGATTLVGLLFVGTTHAFVVAVMIAAGFNISGGHLNPAVTLGLAMGGHITLIRSLLYWIIQCFASALACLSLNYVTGGLVIFSSIFFMLPHYYYIICKLIINL